MALDGLTSEHSITIATWWLVVSTVGLVAVTVLLYLDGLSRGKQQEKRWAREDLLRAEDARPIALVELGKQEPSAMVIALCYNLGKHAFVIDKMTVSFVDRVTRTSDLAGPHIVLPGTFVPVAVDCTDLMVGRTGYNDGSVVFQLKGAVGVVETEPAMFNMYPSGKESFDWDLSIAKYRLPGMLVRFPRMIPTEKVESKLITGI